MGRRLVPANPRSKADIEQTALKIIKRFQPGTLKNKPFDIERFFDCHLEDITGVSADYRELQDGIYGFTDSDEKTCVISADLADDLSQERFYRSTMAHEIGHAMMHVRDYRLKRAILRSIHKKGHHQLRVYRESEIKIYMNPEWQAWRFAGAILMPESAFRAAVDRGYEEYDLAERFNVNPAFVRTRFNALYKK